MFEIFLSKPPLSTFSRVDIELLLRRNLEVIGTDVIASAPQATDLSALNLDTSSPSRLITSATDEIARRMRVPLSDVQVTHDDDPEFAFASTYRDGVIKLHREVTTDPLRTVVEIANQLAHHFWANIPAPRPLDTHDRTTTLMPIAMGLGVLASRAALQESHWSAAGYSGWSMSRCGYYSAIEIGYALALVSRLTGDSNPPWISSLRLDTKKTFQSAHRYFSRHAAAGQSLLFDASRIPASDRSANELSQWLSGRDPAFAMAAAYALAKLDSLPAIAVDEVLKLTHSKDPELVVLAARLLGKAPRDDSRIDRRIQQLASQRSMPITLAALHSASQRDLPMMAYKTQFEKLLSHPNMDVIPVVELIRKHGHAMTSMSSSVCRQAAAAIRFKDTEATEALLVCLREIVADPIAEVETHIRTPGTQVIAIEQIRSLPHAIPSDSAQ